MAFKVVDGFSVRVPECAYEPCNKLVDDQPVRATLTKDRVTENTRYYLFCSQEHADLAMDWQDEHILVDPETGEQTPYKSLTRAEDSRY